MYFLIHLNCRFFIKPIPNWHNVKWSPWDNENYHNSYGHSECLSLSPAQDIIVWTTKSITICSNKIYFVQISNDKIHFHTHLLYTSCFSYTAQCKSMHNKIRCISGVKRTFKRNLVKILLKSCLCLTEAKQKLTLKSFP